MMTAYPTKLERLAEDRLQIEWSDGRATKYTVRQLRDNCPCATCREKRSVPPSSSVPLAMPVPSGNVPAADSVPPTTSVPLAKPVPSGGMPQPLLPILKPGEAAPLRITAMTPVGNYAYAIAFSDGHDTGIYSFERLLELGNLSP